jgi:hypothetical protein
VFKVGSVQDSLQIGLALYNNGNFTHSLQVFESIALNGENKLTQQNMQALFP